MRWEGTNIPNRTPLTILAIFSQKFVKKRNHFPDLPDFLPIFLLFADFVREILVDEIKKNNRLGLGLFLVR